MYVLVILVGLLCSSICENQTHIHQPVSFCLSLHPQQPLACCWFDPDRTIWQEVVVEWSTGSPLDCSSGLSIACCHRQLCLLQSRPYRWWLSTLLQLWRMAGLHTVPKQYWPVYAIKMGAQIWYLRVTIIFRYIFSVIYVSTLCAY